MAERIRKSRDRANTALPLTLRTFPALALLLLGVASGAPLAIDAQPPDLVFIQGVTPAGRVRDANKISVHASGSVTTSST